MEIIDGPLSLDSFTTTGVWHQNRNEDTGASYPARAAGLLEVYALGYWTHQRYTTVYGDVYIRRAAGVTWSKWSKVTAFRESDTALIRTSAVSGNWAQWDTVTLPTWLTTIRNNEGITTPPGRYRLEVVGSSRLAVYLNGNSVGGLEAGVYLYDGELSLYDSRGNAHATITRLV